VNYFHELLKHKKKNIMNWLKRKALRAFGGGVIKAHTCLTARLIVDGKYTEDCI